jgi:hypothetical protein
MFSILEVVFGSCCALLTGAEVFPMRDKTVKPQRNPQRMLQKKLSEWMHTRKVSFTARYNQHSMRNQSSPISGSGSHIYTMTCRYVMSMFIRMTTKA